MTECSWLNYIISLEEDGTSVGGKCSIKPERELGEWNGLWLTGKHELDLVTTFKSKKMLKSEI